jgi:hypothetical protein
VRHLLVRLDPRGSLGTRTAAGARHGDVLGRSVKNVGNKVGYERERRGLELIYMIKKD